MTLRQMLTPREYQVVGLIAKGLNVKAIATVLKIKPTTVKAYAGWARKKARSPNRTAIAVQYVLEEERRP